MTLGAGESPVRRGSASRAPTPDRHLDVQDDHVGVQPPRQSYSLLAVLRLAYDLYTLVRLEHLLEALAEHGMVVGQEHSNATATVASHLWLPL